MPIMPGSNPNDDNSLPIYDDLFSNDEEKNKRAWGQLYALMNAKRQAQAGFFDSYRSIGDFGKTLAAPIIAPLVLGVCAGIAVIVAAAAAISAAGCLIFSGGAALFGNKTLAKDSLVIAQTALIVAGLATLITAALAIITAVAFPAALIQLVTRSVSTLVTPLIDCCSTAPMTEEMHSGTAPSFQ